MTDPRPTSLVTGANTGIGQGIALAAARAGAHVVGVGRSAMDDTAALVAAAGASFTPLICDLSDLDAARATLERAWELSGGIDGLVNNAGIIRRSDAVDLSEADWDAVMEVNLRTPFFLSQAFARMAFGRPEPRGRIVNVASLLSFQGGIRVASYTASKHGLTGITRILANEWAARGINVNAVAPGYVVSNNTEALRADPDRSAAILS
ncbi:MAG: SDR family NAD(P)-dependent oxidoreductase, partial [Actinobacteria bacterium]|nr:SDR family NAD(P)-dependent oxidoreductase [Actinomycetota bacterium]